jgi:malate permease and related proteins
MLEIYIKLLPVFGFFTLGIILNSFRLIPQRYGGSLLMFMFYITLPALILVKLTEFSIGLDKFYLPLLNIGINLSCMLVMLLLTWKMSIDRRTLGVMLVSSMILNNIITFPFILTVLGDQAFTEVIIFDIGNAFMTITLTYIVAFRFGPETTSFRKVLTNMLKLPAIWALILAIYLNLNFIYLPEKVISMLQPVGSLTSPLILISLGIYFTPKIKQFPMVATTVFVRMFVGFIVGLSLANVFELKGSTYMIVVLCSAAPIGFNAVTYAKLAKLDMEFATSAVSFSILIGMISSPILLYYLQS